MAVMRGRAASAILMTEEDEVLLLQRDDDSSFGGWWTLPGGKVEPGEHPFDGVRREVMEETELAPVMMLWRVYDRPYFAGDQVVVIEQYLYHGRITRDTEVHLHEGQAYGFFSRTALKTVPIAFGYDTVLESWFAALPQKLDDLI